MKNKLTVPLAAVLLLFGGIAADNRAEEGAGSAIDWRKNTITSYGVASIDTNYEGKPVNSYSDGFTSINEARRETYGAAKVVATERLVTILKGLQVTQEETLGRIISESSFTRKNLHTIIEQARCDLFPAGFDSTGCRIRLSVGDIICALPFTFPQQDFPSRMDVPVPTKYTGLIIDGRGLDIKKMILPVIYNRNGLEIVSRRHISASEAAKHGMVSYVADENEAKKNKRLGSHPLFAAAVGENRGCPVLSERDVRRIFGSRENLQALKECRIVFIIDRE